ncbi:MAG: class I SAM-dependent methyltransferase [Bacteroidota bacterium]|nr:class I SAM-dependent methyltransferase [Bacteroidota bacterium]
MKLYLDLEWIFERLALETSFTQYGSKDHPIRKFASAFILHRIDATSKVLDLGCKTGEMSMELASKGAYVVGIDHDAKAIEEARQKHMAPNLEFQCTDAVDYLKKNERKFDVLILSHILEHLDDPAEFLDEFKVHFDLIYIELPDFDRSYLNQYRKDLGSELIYTDDDHVSEFDRMELGEMLKDRGIVVMDAEYRFGMQRLWCKVQR